MTNKEILLLSLQTGLIKENRISARQAADVIAFVIEHVTEEVINNEINKGRSITDMVWEALEYYIMFSVRPNWLSTK